MGPGAPALRGVWNPVVGAGGVYQIDRPGGKGGMEMAVVGQETVDGKPAYWFEMAMSDPRSGGQVFIKQLMVKDGDRAEVKRMILQTPGRPPLEMPVTMPGAPEAQGRQSADVRKEGERVGVEQVTTPAGTFTCEHYRTKDGTADVWVAEKVAPWGLVKMTSKDANMTLTRVLTNATSKVTGTPQKFDPGQMMRPSR
jgi:hypothetical protein